MPGWLDNIEGELREAGRYPTPPSARIEPEYAPDGGWGEIEGEIGSKLFKGDPDEYADVVKEVDEARWAASHDNGE